jgi:hypothetical protein
VTAGWSAAVTRGRALLRRTVGPVGAVDLIDAPSWEECRRRLAGTSYGTHLPDDADRCAAAHAVHDAAVWQLRVLAGWLPPGGSGLARLAVAPFEIANIEHHLGRLAGGPDTTPFELGALSIVWPRLTTASTTAEVRTALARSAWGDPGGHDRATIALGLRVAWARRTMASAAVARPWALGAMAVLVAREQYVFGRTIADPTARDIDRALGARWRSATSIDELVQARPDAAAWPLRDLHGPADLWQAELEVVRRVADDAGSLARSSGRGRNTVVAIMAMLLVDAWRAAAAIEGAGSGRIGREVLGAAVA